jgi:hypothetical protein
MATPAVWISTATNDVTADGDDPGDHSQRIGVIDTSAQADFYTHIQVYIGARRTTNGKPEFYLSGDPDSVWVQQAKYDPRRAAAVLDPHQAPRRRAGPLQQWQH